MRDYNILIVKTIRHVQERFPSFKIVDKEQSALMRILGALLFFTNFKKYTTTIGYTVYYPGGFSRVFDGENIEKIHFIAVLLHEFTHMCRRKKIGWIYNLIYLTPQIFALGALLGFFYWPLFLLVFFLAPIPSIGRAWIEFEGYCTTCAVYQWLGIQVSYEAVIRQFTTSSYYWMFPLYGLLDKWFTSFLFNLNNGVMSDELKQMKALLAETG